MSRTYLLRTEMWLMDPNFEECNTYDLSLDTYCVEDSQEGDDSRSGARGISNGQLIGNKSLVDGDDDWFEFDSDDGELHNFRVRFNSAAVDVDWEAWFDGTEVADGTFTGGTGVYVLPLQNDSGFDDEWQIRLVIDGGNGCTAYDVLLTEQ